MIRNSGMAGNHGNAKQAGIGWTLLFAAGIGHTWTKSREISLASGRSNRAGTWEVDSLRIAGIKIHGIYRVDGDRLVLDGFNGHIHR